MKVRTFSIVAGSMACQARCPFCVAHMTPKNGIGSKAPDINWRNFKKACQFARDGGCSTAMITSKGEPTIFPDQVSEFLQNLAPFNFPVIELQTNGLLIADGPGNKVTDQHLKDTIQRDGFYLRIPAGKLFYLYLTEPIAPPRDRNASEPPTPLP